MGRWGDEETGRLGDRETSTRYPATLIKTGTLLIMTVGFQ